MRHSVCMQHLVYMRTRVRVGVADGAIDVTSTVAGKVSELAASSLGFVMETIMSVALIARNGSARRAWIGHDTCRCSTISPEG
jgi:hypothetical protein